MKHPESTFQAAAIAVVDGDLEALASLLRGEPTLSVARSPKHGATLLHYVAANGPVEDELQRTPANAVEIARALLSAGAVVDAIIDGDSASTPLVGLVTSEFPAVAELQGRLVRAFVDGGAAVNGLDDDGYPLSCALEFGYPDAVDALLSCGARVEGLVATASLGRLDAVKACFDDRGGLRPDAANYVDPFRREFGPDDVQQLALERAEFAGHASIVEFLSANSPDR